MKFYNYFEARRETREAKKKGQTIPVRLKDIEELKKYKGEDDVFISFRSLDKIGINPKSQYNTPNGIYTYPINYVLNNSEKKIDVPFAGDNPYIYVVKAKGKGIDDLYQYSSLDYDNDIDKLEKHFPNVHDLEVSARKGAHTKNPGGIMWNLTRLLSKNNPVQWTKILYNILGYGYIADKKGQGIIHVAEDTQAVFFSVKAFTIIDKIVVDEFKKSVFNKNKKEAGPRYWTGGIWDGKEPWTGGIWRKGTWGKGTFTGTWKDGIWKYGTFAQGIWENGVWHEGTFGRRTYANQERDLTWYDGVWKDGEWYGGTWKGGEWNDGTWHYGTWEKGIWKDGKWLGGYWRGGEWKDGVWLKGWIYDPKRKGKIDEIKKWEGDYAYSMLNPRKYFA